MNYAYVHPKDNEIYWSPVPKPEEELCYFLEEQTGSWFVDHGIRFTNNPLKAKRFKTKRDAEKLFRGVAFPSCKVTEHLFIPDRSALKAFEDGLTVKYEDREMVERLMPKDAFEFFPSNGNPFGGGYKLKPGTCIPIDVEGEVVERCLNQKEQKISGCTRIDCFNAKKCMHLEKVFRITK